jgi:archaellum component FlaF (FlaF/FlaG flagellin family)
MFLSAIGTPHEYEKENGEIVEFNNESQILNPGEKLTLTVTTDLGGKSEIQGVLKYKVSANGQEIIRQLDFKFNVGNRF